MRQDNVPGFPGYYISKSGRVYSRYIIQKLSLKITSAGISSIYKKYQEGYYTGIVH